MKHFIEREFSGILSLGGEFCSQTPTWILGGRGKGRINGKGKEGWGRKGK